MAVHHRSQHIPLTFGRFGSTVKLIPDLALATHNKENHDVDSYITSWKKYIIRSPEEFAAPTLSYKFYGTVDYYWFLCWYNGIINPTRELKAGMEIKVPDYAQMVAYLSDVEKGTKQSFVRV